MATSPTSPATPWPLYDLFLDLPHPAASKSCPKPFLIASPVQNPVSTEIQNILPQIARFAFPEYDGSSSTQQQQQQTNNDHQAATLNAYDLYAMQNESFLHFTFSLQLQSGARLHGHVRRYLPPHLVARSRYDVGRRGERALVVLTRATGADLLYTAILKSVEAISSQQAALSPDKMPHAGKPQEWFLHQLSRYQQHLSQVYAGKQQQDTGKPLVAAIPGLEFGEDNLTMYRDFDTSRFIIPTSLLKSMSSSSSSSDTTQAAAGSIVPLLRCVGVAHAVRILSALLSERRVILVSGSPTRLTVCSHAAVSMLAQGLLHWQHLYIPVLPPHLWQYLAAPYPYLVGILQHTLPRLERTDGLGEVLIIHLDTNQMETRGMESGTILQRLPDLFRTVSTTLGGDLPNQAMAAASPSEMLAQELCELLKHDKKVLYGESTLANVSEIAAKSTKAVKKTFFKLRDKGRQYLQQRSGTGVDSGSDDEGGGGGGGSADELDEEKTMASDYIYTEACHNAVAEEEARISFTAFFLCMFGDMRWYLTTPPGGGPPVLDRNKFLAQKRAMGDGEGTPMWPLLNNFCQTQMLEEFAKARVEEVKNRTPVTKDAPLFLQCASYCRQHQMDFGLLNIRRITRQVAEGNPSRLTGMLQTNARRVAMTLTSNKSYEGDYARTIAQLVEQCRESTSVLFDVMSVIWLRLRDSKGMQWKHGYQALILLRNLLYHGPLASISEATDGLAKIRAMKFYENMRSQSVQQVRTAAATVYNLLVDRAKLFQIRRVCAERRRVLQSKTEPKRIRETNTRIGVPFRNIHAVMHPNAARGTVVKIPPKAPSNQTMARGPPQQQPQAPAGAVDLLGVGAPPQASQQGVGSAAANDMAGLFDNMAVTQSSSTNGTAASNPFDAFGSSGAGAAGSGAPTGGVVASTGPTETPAFAQPPSQQNRAVPSTQQPMSAYGQQAPTQQQVRSSGPPQVAQNSGQARPPQQQMQQHLPVQQQPQQQHGPGGSQQQQANYAQQGYAAAGQQRVQPGYMPQEQQQAVPPSAYAQQPGQNLQYPAQYAQPPSQQHFQGQPPHGSQPQPQPQQQQRNTSQFDPFASR